MAHGLLLSALVQMLQTPALHVAVDRRCRFFSETGATAAPPSVLRGQLRRQLHFWCQDSGKSRRRLHQQLDIGAVGAAQSRNSWLHHVRETPHKVGQPSTVLPDGYLQLLSFQQLVHVLQASNILKISLHGELVVAQHRKPRLHRSSSKVVAQGLDGGLQKTVRAKPNAWTGKLEV